MKKIINLLYDDSIRFILFIVFLVSILTLGLVKSCDAQINGTFKSVKFVNADSTEIISKGIGNYTGSGGIIYYNEDQNKFRAYQDSVWIDLIGSGGGGGGIGEVVAGSGLTNVNDSTINLGGNITSNVVLDYQNTYSHRQIFRDFTQPFPPFNTESVEMDYNITNPNGLFLGNTNTFDGFYVSSNTQNFSTSATGSFITIAAFNPSFANQINIRANGGANNNLQINDTRVTTRGLQYAANYSAGYDDRSLVDRGYVTSNFWPLSGNFSTTGAQAISIGGDLSFIGGTGEDIILQSNLAASTLSLQSTSAGLVSSGAATSNVTSASNVEIDAGQNFIVTSDTIQLLKENNATEISILPFFGQDVAPNFNILKLYGTNKTRLEIGAGNLLDTVQVSFVNSRVNNFPAKSQLSRRKTIALVGPTPTQAEITTACACSDFFTSGIPDGEWFYLFDTNGNNMFLVTNNSSTWYYQQMTLAP